MADNLVATGIELDTRLMLRAIEQAERRLNALEEQVDRAGRTAKGAERDFLKFAAGAAAAFGAFAAARTASRFIFDTNVAFQQLEARLESITGSARGAEAAFQLITDFAVETPFSVENLTRAFTTLQAVGIEPTKDMLRDLGNFASAMGGNIEEFVQAIAKAAMGETTQLRERFFQVVRSEGDKLFVTFRGVEYQMDRTFEGVVEGFRRISRANFAGAMDKQMQTLAGSISNLKDASALAAREVGEAGLNAAINELANEITEAIKLNDEFARSLGENLADGVRVSGNALMLLLRHLDEIVNAMKVLAAVGGGLAASTLVARIIAMRNAFVAAGGAAAAMSTTLTALGGPIGIVIGLLTAGTTALLLFRDKADDTLTTIRDLSDEVGSLASSFDKLTEAEAKAAIAKLQPHFQQLLQQLDTLQRRRDELARQRIAAGPVTVAVRGTGTTIQKERPKSAEEEALDRSIVAMQEAVTVSATALTLAHQRAADSAKQNAADQKAAAAEIEKDFKKLTERLEEQRIELEKGKRAAFEYQLQLEGFGPAQRQQALEIFDAIQALEQKKKAEEDAAKEAERNREAVERTIAALEEQNLELVHGEEALLRYTLAQQGAKKEEIERAIALHRANEAQRKKNEADEEARKKADDERRARLQAEANALKQAAGNMADEVTQAFEAWVTGSEKAVDAVSDMVTGILREISRLAIQRAITEPLVDLLSGVLGGVLGGIFGGSSGADIDVSAPPPKVAPIPPVRVPGRAMGGPIDPGRPYLVGERGPEIIVPRSSGTVVPNTATGVVFHQTVQFSITALDAPAVADLLRSQKATIATVVADAARESTAFRQALAGR